MTRPLSLTTEGCNLTVESHTWMSTAVPTQSVPFTTASVHSIDSKWVCHWLLVWVFLAINSVLSGNPGPMPASLGNRLIMLLQLSTRLAVIFLMLDSHVGTDDKYYERCSSRTFFIHNSVVFQYFYDQGWDSLCTTKLKNLCLLGFSSLYFLIQGLGRTKPSLLSSRKIGKKKKTVLWS